LVNRGAYMNIIYLVTNIVNNKKYVGQTMGTLNERNAGIFIMLKMVAHIYYIKQ